MTNPKGTDMSTTHTPIPTEREFGFWFESEFGIEIGTVSAPTFEVARRQLAKENPNDVGADGQLEDHLTGRVGYPWPE